MAEKNYDHVLDDVQTSDEEDSEESCEDSEGEVISLSADDADEEYYSPQEVLIKKQTNDYKSAQHVSTKREVLDGDLPRNVVIKEEVDLGEDYLPAAKRPKRLQCEPRPGPKTCGRGSDPIWWYHKQLPRSRSPETTSNRYLPAVIGEPTKAKTPLDAWSYFINDEMINSIVTHTNEEILRTKKAHNLRQTYHREIDDVELKACIGLLYLAGVYRQNTVDLTDLWGDDPNPTTFRVTMTAHRFKFILRCLSFDDKSTRPFRRRTDRLAACRDIWETFIGNCMKFYSPTAICTIDEELEPFNGKCTFKIRSGRDSNSSGLKFLLINDSKTKYMINAIPYLGKITDNALKEPVSHYFVRKLVSSIVDSGRTVIMNETFTTVDMFQRLNADFGLKGLGPMHKKKSEIPSSFLEKGLPGTILCGTNGNVGLISYVSKENKLMTVLSSGIRLTCVHATIGKVDVINTYNVHKGATDFFVQTCKTYTVARRTRRWPLRVFFSILDKANVNATITYNLLHPNGRKRRKDFMKELSLALISSQLQRRKGNQSLRTASRRKIAGLLGQDKSCPEDDQVVDLETRVKCIHCPPLSGVKTKIACSSCQEPMCSLHRCSLCVKCAHV